MHFPLSHTTTPCIKITRMLFPVLINSLQKKCSRSTLNFFVATSLFCYLNKNSKTCLSHTLFKKRKMQWCSPIHLHEKHQNRIQVHLVLFFFCNILIICSSATLALQVFSATYLLTFNSKALILISFAAHGWSFIVFKDSLSTVWKSPFKEV